MWFSKNIYFVVFNSISFTFSQRQRRQNFVPYLKFLEIFDMLSTCWRLHETIYVQMTKNCTITLFLVKRETPQVLETVPMKDQDRYKTRISPTVYLRWRYVWRLILPPVAGSVRRLVVGIGTEWKEYLNFDDPFFSQLQDPNFVSVLLINNQLIWLRPMDYWSYYYILFLLKFLVSSLY